MRTFLPSSLRNPKTFTTHACFYRLLSSSAQAPVIKHYTLGGLATSEIHMLIVGEVGSLRSQCQHGLVLVRAFLQVVEDGLLVSLIDAKGRS